jgi:hypothetical protein
MRAPLALLASLCLMAPAPASPPDSIQVRVLVHPAGARFLCGRGRETQAGLRLKAAQLPPDGLIQLQRDSDYSPLTDQIPVGLDAPGYAPYFANVSLSQLSAQQPGPALLWPQPVVLQPVSWQARARENPLYLILPTLALGIAAAAALQGRKLARQGQGQKQRAARLRELGLERDQLVGRVIDGLHILEPLGSGGMATVYRVEPLDQPGQFLALKLLHPDSHYSKSLDRFHREVTICSRLRHPRLTLLHRAVDCDGMLGLLMELVPGTSLRAQIKPQGLPLKTVLDWLGAICQGLFYAHHQGVVHRDLKPDNVMLTPGGQIKVMDFGIARVQDGAKISESNSVIGTVAYMAPEQIGGGAVTPALDQYALGIMLFELLTGQVPFRSDNPFEVFRMHLESPRPQLAKARPDLPSGLQAVLDKMLAVKPEERFGDIERAMRTLRFAAEKP